MDEKEITTMKEQILKYKDEMIADLAKLVSFESIKAPKQDNAPFGEANARCLDAALEIVEKCGLKTTNLDYYAGYGEIGSGEKLIGILGHLDIVPTGAGWMHPPLELSIRNGKMYGRGVSDDKGPLIAAAYALRILKESGQVFDKRVRLIMGCDEESGSSCLKYYVEKEGHMDYGFTPDAMFPGVFGEKGAVGATFSAKTKMLKLEGGIVANAVCAKVSAEFALDSFDVDAFLNYMQKNNIQAKVEQDCTVQVVVMGIAAHASTPEYGKNAISYFMKGLQEAGYHDDLVDYYNEKIGTGYYGELANVDFKDEYGRLTFCNGMIKLENDVAIGTIDIRFPVTMNSSPVVEQLKQSLNNELGQIKIKGTTEPLFYEKDSDLVRSLVQAFQEVTNDFSIQPETMGGGTYAKGINNCIAFGGAFPGTDNHIHDVDEVLDIEEFLLQVEIYAKAIQNLLAL